MGFFGGGVPNVGMWKQLNVRDLKRDRNLTPSSQQAISNDVFILVKRSHELFQCDCHFDVTSNTSGSSLRSAASIRNSASDAGVLCQGYTLSMSVELTSKPLLARLLRLVETSEGGVTANEAAKAMGKHLGERLQWVAN